MTDIGLMLISYNRPRLLAEALASVRDQTHPPTQIVIADDASDFDPADIPIVRELACEIVRSAPMSVEDRLTKPHMGKLYNRALERIWCPVVTYLCDDDLLAPGWFKLVSDYFDAAPLDGPHMVRGDWLIHGLDTTAFIRNDGWQLTTGNFAHLTHCVEVEECWWHEGVTAVQDVLYLGGYLAKHPHLGGGGQQAPLLGLAGWRREHEYNLIRYTAGLYYAQSAEEVLRRGFLEEKVVTHA